MNSSLYNDIFSIYTLSEFYDRKIALDLLEFVPVVINVDKDNYLYKEMGIYEIYFINEYNFNFYSDIRILLRNNIEKIHKLSCCKFTINISHYSKNKLDGEQFFIIKAPVYFNINMKGTIINFVGNSYAFYDINVIKSWIKAGIHFHLKRAGLYISLNEVSISDIYSLLILLFNTVLNGNIFINKFSLYVLDTNYIKDVNNMFNKYEGYVATQYKLLNNEQLNRMKNFDVRFHTL